MRTAMIYSPEAPAALENAHDDRAFDIAAETELGRLSLGDFLAHPQSGARAIVVVRNGRVIAESYPDRHPEQPHLWASCAKPMAGLLIEHLIDDGLIDESRTLGDYIPALRDTDWSAVTVPDALDMTPGMDCEENDETRDDPSSNAIRAFLAEFDIPYDDKTETLLEVLQSSRRVGTPGETFEYGSPCSQVLVLLAEPSQARRGRNRFAGTFGRMSALRVRYKCT